MEMVLYALVWIGIFTNTDLVIPVESPDRETVTLISEYALYSLEDVDSITFVSYNYKIGKYAPLQLVRVILK